MTLSSSCLLPTLFLVSSAFVAIACGQVVTPGGSSEPPPTLAVACQAQASSGSLVEACTAFIQKRDAYATTCGGFGDAPFDEQAAIDSCVALATSPGALVTPGDIDGCASSLCGGCEITLYPACVGYEGDLLFPNHDKKGTSAPGAPCVAHIQCASGYCSSYGDDCGHCENARFIGDSCTGELDKCEDAHAECSNAGVCELSGKHLGEVCSTYGEGDCQGDLFCNPTDPSTVSGICEARIQIGGACVANQERCLPGLGCFGGVCQAPLADGATCQSPSQCVHSCVDGTCGKPVIPLHAGDACSSEFGCGHDLYCDQSSHCAVGCSEDPSICAPRPENGQPCDMNGNCAPDAVCVGFNPSQGTKGLCTRKGGEGEACPCGDDLSCVDGKCVVYGAALCQ